MPAPRPLPHTRTPLPQDHSKLPQPCNPQTTGTQAWLPREPLLHLASEPPPDPGPSPEGAAFGPTGAPSSQLCPCSLPASRLCLGHAGSHLPWGFCTCRLLCRRPCAPRELQARPLIHSSAVGTGGQPQAKPSAEAPRVRALEPRAPWSPRSQQVVLGDQIKAVMREDRPMSLTAWDGALGSGAQLGAIALASCEAPRRTGPQQGQSTGAGGLGRPFGCRGRHQTRCALLERVRQAVPGAEPGPLPGLPRHPAAASAASQDSLPRRPLALTAAPSPQPPILQSPPGHPETSRRDPGPWPGVKTWTRWSFRGGFGAGQGWAHVPFGSGTCWL